MLLDGQPAGETPIPVRTVDATSLPPDLTLFYKQFAAEPLIVRGAFDANEPLNALTLAEIGRLLADTPMHVYNSGAGDSMDVPASEVLKGMTGEGAPRNIIDCYITDHALGKLVDVPWFLAHNWFIGPPAGRDEVEKSLILSPAGSFTSLHLDAYGMQGWMYLIEGEKTWGFYRPADALRAFDPASGDFHHPNDATDHFEGTIRAGDLIYFPSGWLHEVRTTRTSYGVSGALLNDFQIEEHMRCWLCERSHGFGGSMDLKRVILEMPAERYAGHCGHIRARRAITLREKWETRIQP
jgi:hypothetical protein